MNVNFGVYCMGYSVGGRDYPFDIDIDESELEGMSEDEKFEYIHKICFEYVLENIEVGIDID